MACEDLRHVCGACGFKWPERSAYDELTFENMRLRDQLAAERAQVDHLIDMLDGGNVVGHPHDATGVRIAINVLLEMRRQAGAKVPATRQDGANDRTPEPLDARLRRLEQETAVAGWDGPRSKAISAKRWSDVKTLVDLARTEPFVAPCGDGAVHVRWADERRSISLELADDGVFWAHCLGNM